MGKLKTTGWIIIDKEKRSIFARSKFFEGQQKIFRSKRVAKEYREEYQKIFKVEIKEL